MRIIITAIIATISMLGIKAIPEPQVEKQAIILPSTATIFDPRESLPMPTTTTSEPIRKFSDSEIRCPEWHDLARSVGIKKRDLPTAMRIVYRESRCFPWVKNTTLNRDGSIDYGLAQINDRTWCLPSRYYKQGYLQSKGIIERCEDLLKPEINLRAMVELMAYSEGSSGCAFTPWRMCD